MGLEVEGVVETAMSWKSLPPEDNDDDDGCNLTFFSRADAS